MVCEAALLVLARIQMPRLAKHLRHCKSTCTCGPHSLPCRHAGRSRVDYRTGTSLALRWHLLHRDFFVSVLQASHQHNHWEGWWWVGGGCGHGATGAASRAETSLLQARAGWWVGEGGTTCRVVVPEGDGF